MFFLAVEAISQSSTACESCSKKCESEKRETYAFDHILFGIKFIIGDI